MLYKINSHNLVFIVFFILSTFCSIDLFSQEVSVSDKYYLIPFIINPAATGAEYYPIAVLSLKKQWANFPEAPSSILLAGNYKMGLYDFYNPKGLLNKGPIKITKYIGLGAAIYHDEDGPQSTTGINISCAYHMPVNSISKFSIGISGIGAFYSLNSSVLKPDQSNDPFLFDGKYNAFRANLNFGVYYYSDTYFAGLSATRIFQDIDNLNNPVRVKPTYFFTGGYKFGKKLNPIIIEPSIAVKKTDGEIFIIDLHTKFYIRQLNWVAISYSTTAKINFRLGLNLYKNIYAGYCYEYTFGEISSYTSGSHELNIGINLGLMGIVRIKKTRGY